MPESKFLKHEPCPNCHSRNNLGVWDDGHKYCFGCGFYVPPTKSVDFLKRRTKMENNNKDGDSALDVSSFTFSIPQHAQTWLKKYGITDQEVRHYGICWNSETDSLVFPVERGGQVVLTNERYFGKDPLFPKYRTYGHKALNRTYFNNPNTPNSLVIVEDFISAVKVARFASSIPLFGSTISAEAVKWVVGTFKSLRIWLDRDKASESLKEASKLSQWIPDTRTIITELDPKEYSNNEILAVLKKYKVLQGL